MSKRSLRNAQVSGKKVLLRCDFNVPYDSQGNISDTRRIDESLESINFLINNNAKLILCSHFRRPHGNVDPSMSLKKVADCLSQKIGKTVKLASDVVGENARALVSEMHDGDVCMLENLRFEIGEETNDPEFSKQLASLADIYVNDAFGACHREHASLVGVPSLLPSYCGFLIEKEVRMISSVVESPVRPFISILGGAKVSDKIGVIENLVDKVDTFIIGGGMTYTFMNALGYKIGDSICEHSKLSLAKDILSLVKEKGVKLLLPVDCKIGKEYAPDTETQVVPADQIPDGWQGLDIKLFCDELKHAGSVVWNGPVGVSEWPAFEDGTFSLARLLASSNAKTVVGGGDVAAAVNKAGVSDSMYHISTGGGASLMFLEGKELPGIKALPND